MRTIVPYANLYPETRAALEADERLAEYHHVAGTNEAYYDLLRAVWAGGSGFVVIEQDIVPYPGAIAELEGCECDWGGFAYNLGTSMAEGCLGCTKFSDRLVRDNPAVIEATTLLRDDGTGRRSWTRLDTRLKQVLEDQVGLKFHVHWPAVEHLNKDKDQFRANCVHCGEMIPWSTIMAGPAPYDHDCTEEQWIAPPPAPKPDDGTNTVLVRLD